MQQPIYFLLAEGRAGAGRGGRAVLMFAGQKMVLEKEVKHPVQQLLLISPIFPLPLKSKVTKLTKLFKRLIDYLSELKYFQPNPIFESNARAEPLGAPLCWRGQCFAQIRPVACTINM
jgi:hypothetical protein